MFRKALKAVITVGLIVAPIATSYLEAQTARALERRADRNSRQAQRQANRADYYSNQAWQQVSPWIEKSGVKGATAASVGANARGATNTSRANPYGFRDNSAANAQWFYDYYRVAPTYYSRANGADAYGAAVRYFDADNDGVYDSYAQYRDSNKDGSYDEYDRLDFVTGSKGDSDDFYGPAESKRYTVKGTVEATKKADVGDSQNLLAQVKQSGDAEDAIVDLGPTDNPALNDVKEGTKIAASGTIEHIGDKKLIVADTVAIGGQEEFAVRRFSTKPLTGQIVDVQKIEVHSVPHYLGVVETGEGKQLVDLGPAKTYKSEIKPSTKVVIQGIPVKTHDHTVILADEVDIDGQSYTVDRTESLSF